MSRAQTIKRYDSLEGLLIDKDLAALGDSFVNFIYSLALSQKHRRPMGAKVDNQTLAQAVVKSGLRQYLPHRFDRHAQGDAAEALLVFAWLSDMIDFHDCTDVLSKEADTSAAFANLIRGVLEKIGVLHEEKQAST